MDFFQPVCYLHARVPRIRYAECGMLQGHVPWARPGIEFTMLSEALVMSMATHMPVATISRHVREYDTRLWHILEHHVACTRDREDFYGVMELAIDETLRRRGQKYVSLAAAVKKRRVLFVTKGKGHDVIDRLADDLHKPGGDPSAVKHVSMDMSPAFIEGLRECLPVADITFDRFRSERGIEARCADSLNIRSFLGIRLTDRVPDHSTLSQYCPDVESSDGYKISYANGLQLFGTVPDLNFQARYSLPSPLNNQDEKDERRTDCFFADHGFHSETHFPSLCETVQRRT